MKIFIQSNKNDIIQKVEDYLYVEKITYTKQASFGQSNTTEYHINYSGNNFYLTEILIKFGVTAFAL